MATIPAHIKTARKKGALAGLEQLHEYLARNTNEGTNGLPAAQEMLATLRKQGGYRKRDGVLTKQDRAVKWYCNHFNAKFHTGDLPATIGGKATTRKTRTVAKQQAVESVPSGDLAEQFAQFQAFLAMQQGADVTDESDDIEDIDDDTDDTPTRTVRRVSRGDTDEAPSYPPPRDPDAPATQGKLWKLNAEGPDNGLYVCVIDSENNILAGGDGPITAQEAYDLIGEHIA